MDCPKNHGQAGPRSYRPRPPERSGGNVMDMSELNSKIGSRIRAFRILRRLSADDLADVIGVKKNSITRIEAGRLAITAAQLVLVAQKLSTTSSVLTGEQPATEGGEA
ncbi:helix-turn-helix transcriptional regulator [Brucella anthropi]|nr:helix-turn-helix transcriptional regulator [Brucella anthropi]